MSGSVLAADVEALLTEQAAELPQKDELCGAFWGLVALRTAGVRTDGAGRELDQDAVARAAGSRLSPPPRDRSLPPSTAGRDDYRIALPIDVDDPGTSAAGVAHAITELSAGRLAVVPVTGEWRAERLLGLLARLAEAPPVAVLANLHTGPLWPAGTTEEQQARYLDSGEDSGLDSDWRVGHFVALTALRRGTRGSLVEVADTYPGRGIDGRHPQPIERVAAALAGPDKPRGLLVVDRHTEWVRALVARAELQPRLWDELRRSR